MGTLGAASVSLLKTLQTLRSTPVLPSEARGMLAEEDWETTAAIKSLLCLITHSSH